MIAIRKYIFAGLLALTTLNLAPALAHSQSLAEGRFTLAHEVRWQNALVPAGTYHFSLTSGANMGVLTLSKMSGARAGFMVLVSATDSGVTSDLTKLVLEPTAEGSYVSAMQLPELGVTLHFNVPPAAKTAEKQIARNAPTAPGQ